MKKIRILLYILPLFIISSAFFINSNERLASIVVKAIANYETLKAETPDSYEVMDSWLPDVGIRSKYAILKSVARIGIIEEVTGVKVFRSGPHNQGIQYNASTMGYYNPKFLDLSYSTLEQLFKDPDFTSDAQIVYDRHFKNMLRAYSTTHHILNATWRLNMKEIKSEYSAHLKSGLIPKYYLNDVFGRVSSELKNQNYDYYETETAMGFWLRRSIDGTDQQFLAVLNLIFKYLDPTFHKAVVLKDKLQGMWTNGIEIYGIASFSEENISFEGGGLHEGGAHFVIDMKENVEIFEYEDQTVLLIRDSKDQLRAWYKRMNPSEDLYTLSLLNKTNHQLAGKYIREDNGKRVEFFANRFEVEGLSSNKAYKFAIDEIEFPMDLIYFSDGDGYVYKKNQSGLEFYEAKVTEGYWEEGELITSLIKVDGPTLDNSRKLSGKFPLASTEVLTPGALSYYSSYELKMMRNEIFARYGYPFNSAGMKEYFGNQKWYVRGKSSAANKLTPLEKLNVELIQFEEKRER